MVGTTALVLGAGFSKPAGGPLLAELVAPTVMAASPIKAADKEFLMDLFQKRKAAEAAYSVESLFSDLLGEGTTGARIRVGGESRPAADLLEALGLHLASACAGIRLRRNTRLWRHYVDFVEEVCHEAKAFDVVTFNYDLLAEQVLEDAGIPFGYGGHPNFHHQHGSYAESRSLAHWGVGLRKLHGSVNWGVCRNCSGGGKTQDRVVVLARPYVGHPRKKCPVCHRNWLERGLVPPVVGKAARMQPISNVWRRARQVLRKARHVFVIGYSMPASDQEARSLIREIEGPRKRPRVRVIAGSGGASPSFRKVLKKYDDLSVNFQDLRLPVL